MALNKILIVDDSPAHLTALREAVSGSGAKILSASSGSEAVAITKAEKPDLIFMDIIMDDMDGYNACRDITRNDETKDIPVIFVSTKDQRADHMWAEKQGARKLITKPFTKEQIVEQINLYR